DGVMGLYIMAEHTETEADAFEQYGIGLGILHIANGQDPTNLPVEPFDRDRHQIFYRDQLTTPPLLGGPDLMESFLVPRLKLGIPGPEICQKNPEYFHLIYGFAVRFISGFRFLPQKAMV